MSGEVFIIKTTKLTSIYAAIAVTYPSGSICTCNSKAAKDTTGYALFPVEPGTYTIECHTSDNSKNKSTSVTITENDKGKYKSVTLSYELILFDNGTYASETGGWSGIYGKVLQSSTTCNNMDGEYQWTCQTNNPVDLTGYSNLYVQVASVSESYYFTCEFGVGASRTSHKAKFDIRAVTTYSLPIDRYNEALYLSLYHGGAAQQNGGTDGNTTVQISKVWLT